MFDTNVVCLTSRDRLTRVFLSTVLVCGSASPNTIGIGGTVALWKTKGYLAGLALDGNIIGCARRGIYAKSKGLSARKCSNLLQLGIQLAVRVRTACITDVLTRLLGVGDEVPFVYRRFTVCHKARK